METKTKSPGLKATPTTILSLPDELLVEIFLRVESYGQIDLLRSVCTRFKNISGGILRRAFIKLEGGADVHIAVAEKHYELTLSENCVPPTHPIPIFNLAHRVHTFKSIASQFKLLKALIWNFAQISNGVNFCSGNILDNYVQILSTVAAHKACPSREEDFEMLLERLRSFSSWYARFFTMILKKRFDMLRVPDHYFGTADDQDMLTGMTILSILETCMDATCAEAWLSKGGEKSRIHVRYVINKSWFRVDKFVFCNRQPLARKLIHLLRFVREMVLIINYRHLQIEHRQRFTEITGRAYPEDKISICGISSINKDYTYSEDCERQTLLYRYQNPLADDYLERHSGIQIDIDATCFNDFIPKSLIDKCQPNYPRGVNEDCSFDMVVTAYQFYSEETLSYGINRNLNRPQHYQACCRTNTKDGDDGDEDDAMEEEYESVASVHDWCTIENDFSKFRVGLV